MGIINMPLKFQNPRNEKFRRNNPLLFSPLTVFLLGNETQARTRGSLHIPISIDSRSKAIPIRIFFFFEDLYQLP